MGLYPADGRNPTYQVTAVDLAVAPLATDIFTLSGSATKVIRVLRVGISGTQTTTGAINFLQVKRSASNTGGTFTLPVVVAHDSLYSAPTAVARAYTANPTALGALVGILRADRYLIPTATAAGGLPLVSDPGFGPGQAVVLRGAGETMAINLNGVTLAGGSITIWVEWTEE